MLGALALGGAYLVQFGLGAVPCELCLLERWPWRVAIAIGLAGLFAGGRARRAVPPLGAVVLAVSFVLASLHAGVERGWWPSPFPSCRGGVFHGGSIADQLANMPLSIAKPCDAPFFVVPSVPVSLVDADLLVSLGGLVVLLLLASGRVRRRA